MTTITDKRVDALRQARAVIQPDWQDANGKSLAKWCRDADAILAAHASQQAEPEAQPMPVRDEPALCPINLTGGEWAICEAAINESRARYTLTTSRAAFQAGALFACRAAIAQQPAPEAQQAEPSSGVSGLSDARVEADEARRFAQAEAAKLKGDILKIASAISRAGFTLIRVGDGYELRKTGHVVAQAADAVSAGVAVPEGMRLVPVEPTPEMLDAAAQADDEKPLSDWGKVVPLTHAEVWAAMLAAAPGSEQKEGANG